MKELYLSFFSHKKKDATTFKTGARQSFFHYFENKIMISYQNILSLLCSLSEVFFTTIGGRSFLHTALSHFIATSFQASKIEYFLYYHWSLTQTTEVIVYQVSTVYAFKYIVVLILIFIIKEEFKLIISF